MYFYASTLYVREPYDYIFFCTGKSRRVKLVNWVEKASFKKIQRLLEISEREPHHEILLTVNNLLELS